MAITMRTKRVSAEERMEMGGLDDTAPSWMDSEWAQTIARHPMLDISIILLLLIGVG